MTTTGLMGPKGVREASDALYGQIWYFLGPKVSVKIGLAGWAPSAAGPIWHTCWCTSATWFIHNSLTFLCFGSVGHSGWALEWPKRAFFASVAHSFPSIGGQDWIVAFPTVELPWSQNRGHQAGKELSKGPAFGHFPMHHGTMYQCLFTLRAVLPWTFGMNLK